VIHRLCVHPKHQHQGVAKETMRRAERLICERGYDCIRLDAFTQNPHALKLYEGFGYSKAGETTYRKGRFVLLEKALRAQTEDLIRALFANMANAGDGKVLRTSVDNFQDHPAGGCRMGSDPSTSVVDSWGRAHDHENLFVVGAPTSVSGSCANATLTFCALSLRAAHEIEKTLPRRA
jgi:choline dehydrogenase-like flavoprotein